MSFDIFAQDIPKDVKSLAFDESGCGRIKGAGGDVRRACLRWRAYRDRVCAAPQ